MRQKADAFGTVLRLKITLDGIGNHRVQFRKRIALGGNPSAAARRVPTGNVAASFRTGCDFENDFRDRAHVENLSARPKNVNEANDEISNSVSYPPRLLNHRRGS